MGEILDFLTNTVGGLWNDSGLNALFSSDGWKNLIMILISFVFMYLAIAKGFEPLLLLPISFGMLLTNLPMAEMYHPELWVLVDGHVDYGTVLREGGLLDILYLGVKLQLYPPLIFLGIGCMTDFSPLIANPKSFLHRAASSSHSSLRVSSASRLLRRAPSQSSAAQTARRRSMFRPDCSPATVRSQPATSRWLHIHTWRSFRSSSPRSCAS